MRCARRYPNGRAMMTSGVQALHVLDQHDLMVKVRDFDDFNADNDPHGEHDFGAIMTKGGRKVFWKIDYYDTTLTYASPDPTDPAVTERVLTIMLATEY